DGQYERSNARAHEVGHTSVGGREGEDSIGGVNQPPRKSNPLSLVTGKQLVASLVSQHRRQFPRQVDRITDTGVHSLTTRRAVDVPRVSREEGPPLAEMIRDTMMHAVGREPVHLAHLNLQRVDRGSRYVLESQC